MTTNNSWDSEDPAQIAKGGTGSDSFVTYGPVVAGATSTTPLIAIAPSATTGIALVSAGAAANPIFGTVSPAGGGTGVTTVTGVLTGNGTSPMTGSLVSQYGVIVGSTSNKVASIATGSSGQLLQSGGGAANPAFTTATYPATTTANQLLYSSATNTIAGLATGNNGVLITGATGVPSVLPNGTTGQVLTATTGSPPSWATAASSSITITGDTGGPLTGDSFTFTGGTTGLSFGGAGTTETLSGTLVVANGGSGRASATAYAVICGGTTSTGAHQSIASVGTAGHVLTSNGAGALPSFQTSPAAGSFILIETQTVGGAVATVTFTTGISVTYKNYLLIIHDVLPSSNGHRLSMRTSSNGGVSYASTGYRSGQNGFNDFSSSTINNLNNTDRFVLCNNQANSDPGISATYYLYDVTTGNQVMLSGRQTYNSSNSGTIGFGSCGGRSTNTNVNALQIFFGTGNIASGTFSLYGIVQ
jgi:hypothetical protein